MDDFPRLSSKQVLILELLVSKQKAYGLELISESEGQLKRGSIYVQLSRLEDQGLIESWKEPTPQGQQGPPRRLYKVTGHGARALNANQVAAAVMRGHWGMAM